MEYSGAQDLFRSIRQKLLPLGDREAESISLLLMEHLFNQDLNAVILNQRIIPAEESQAKLDAYINKLLHHHPIQYLIGKAHFRGHEFVVNESTLIPRQETEQLIDLVLDEAHGLEDLALLDIGTGSGCIAISLSLELPDARVEGLDISAKAIATARSNNRTLGSQVNFLVDDIFKFESSAKYDIIVSNPPYVTESEKRLMGANVLNHEPAQALFVSDNNPLVFYKQITELASRCLNLNGSLFFEINEQFGNKTSEILGNYGFSAIQLVKDINNKDRFVIGKYR